jgi:hypothetical protein
VFGLSPNATRKEIDEAYAREKDKYRDLRFSFGRVGEEASEKLEEIEAAYAFILADVGRRTTGKNAFIEIEELLRSQRLDAQGNSDPVYEREKVERAQKMLDDVGARSSEWHYLQSIIYYKRNWHLEARKQLEFALNLEPGNEKYRSSLDSLVKIMANRDANPGGFGSNNDPRQGYTTYNPNNDARLDNGTCTGSCCGDVCLAHCCCQCMSVCCG